MDMCRASIWSTQIQFLYKNSFSQFGYAFLNMEKCGDSSGSSESLDKYYLEVQTCYPIAKHSNKGYSELMAYVRIIDMIICFITCILLNILVFITDTFIQFGEPHFPDLLNF